MAKQEISMERLSSPQIEKLLEKGYNSVIFACGAVEQHGPHLPLFVDAEHGSILAHKIASQLGNTLVAPTIRIGCSDHHMAFSGSLSLRKTTFEAIVSDYVNSMAHHGFKRVMIMPSHGGNFGPLQEMLPRLRAIAPTIRVDAFTDVVAFINVWKKEMAELYDLGDRVGGHADIAETAIMMYLHPDLVRNDLAEKGYMPKLTEEENARIFREGFHTVTPNGIMGDARGATAEMGEKLIHMMVNTAIAFFNKV